MGRSEEKALGLGQTTSGLRGREANLRASDPGVKKERRRGGRSSHWSKKKKKRHREEKNRRTKMNFVRLKASVHVCVKKISEQPKTILGGGSSTLNGGKNSVDGRSAGPAY